VDLTPQLLSVPSTGHIGQQLIWKMDFMLVFVDIMRKYHGVTKLTTSIVVLCSESIGVDERLDETWVTVFG